MAGGRPSDYTPEIIEKTKDYKENYKEQGDVIPSIAGLSVYLKVSRSTIYNWIGQEDKMEFLDILEEILSDQERTLINKGLSGDFNANIAKLALGKHGYSDKQETDVTSKGEKLVSSDAIKELTLKLNEIHRETSIRSDGGATSSLDS